jgi:hypothetical protein
VPRAKGVIQERVRGVGCEVAAGHADERSSGGPLERGRGGGDCASYSNGVYPRSHDP